MLTGLPLLKPIHLRKPSLTAEEFAHVERLREKMRIVSEFFDYEEKQESLPNSGMIWIHRFIPKYDTLDRVSSSELPIAVDMALWQIDFYKKGN